MGYDKKARVNFGNRGEKMEKNIVQLGKGELDPLGGAAALPEPPRLSRAAPPPEPPEKGSRPPKILP